jgi:hypothetical protein
MRRLGHVASLPFPTSLAHANTTLKVVNDSAEMADQLGLFGLYRRNQLLVTGTGAAPPERRQRRERPDIATAEATPQPLYTANAGSLPAQMADGIIEGSGTAPTPDRVPDVHVPNSPAALALEEWAANPRHRLIPDDQNWSSVHQKVGRVRTWHPLANLPRAGAAARGLLRLQEPIFEHARDDARRYLAGRYRDPHNRQEKDIEQLELPFCGRAEYRHKGSDDGGKLNCRFCRHGKNVPAGQRDQRERSNPQDADHVSDPVTQRYRGEIFWCRAAHARFAKLELGVDPGADRAQAKAAAEAARLTLALVSVRLAL